MATNFAGDGSFYSNSAISANIAVVLSTNGGVDVGGATTLPIGFTKADAAAADYVGVEFMAGPGTRKCQVTACPVTAGDVLYAAALGRVAATGTIVVGRLITGAAVGNNASVVEFIPSFGAPA